MGKARDFGLLYANNEEEWAALVAIKHLIVVDVYSKWAGPCRIMEPTITKAKTKVAGSRVLSYTS